MLWIDMQSKILNAEVSVYKIKEAREQTMFYVVNIKTDCSHYNYQVLKSDLCLDNVIIS